MSTLNNRPLARTVTFDANTMWVDLLDGRQLGVPLAFFPRLANAKPSERKKYIISGGGIGIHWEDLDEDISVSALLTGRLDQTSQERKNTRVA